MSRTAVFLALLVLAPQAGLAQGIDAEFEQYKTPEGINQHFYKGRVDSTFFQRRRTYDLECSVSEYTKWGSLVYYLYPAESLIMAALFDNESHIKGSEAVAWTAALTFFYVLPPVGHLFFIHGTNGLRKLHREHYSEPPMKTNGRILYFTGMALRFLMPLGLVYASTLDYDYGDAALFLAYPLALIGPGLQWHGLQKVDDERLFLSGALDEVKVSPSLGLKAGPRDGLPMPYFGLTMEF